MHRMGRVKLTCTTIIENSIIIYVDVLTCLMFMDNVLTNLNEMNTMLRDIHSEIQTDPL